MSIFLNGFKSFIKVFLPFFIIFNLYIFIIAEYGDTYNLLHVDLTNFDSHSYFGFRSLLMFIDDFPIDIWNRLLQLVMDLGDIFLFRIPTLLEMMSTWDTSSSDVVELVKVLLDIIFQPIRFILQIFYILAYFTGFIMNIIFLIFDALGGKYNIPYRDSPYPLEPPSSYVFTM